MRISTLYVALLLAASVTMAHGDINERAVILRLARYGISGKAVTRIIGADVVDWPKMTLDGKPVFEKSAEETRSRGASDMALMPGRHMLRFDGDGLTVSDLSASVDGNVYTLRLFPVLIKTGLPNVLRNVTLRVDGKVVYELDGPVKSLTLLLPQNEPTKPYELMANGKGPAVFSVGLKPTVTGAAPQLIPLSTMVAATRPRVLIGYSPSLLPTR